MANTYEKAMERISELVHEACIELKYGIDQHAIHKTVQESKEGFADMCCTVSFSLAKEARKPPKEIAESISSKLQEKIREEKDFYKVEAVNGYINFCFSNHFFEKNINAIDENFGKEDMKHTKVMIEFPSVNPNKPWHIGHLRNALIGESLSRILSFYGFDVKKIDYIDDLGLQVAISTWGFMKLNNQVAGRMDHWLGAQYVEANKLKNDDEIKALLKKMEEGGEEGGIARELSEKCARAQRETCALYGVWHHALVFESDLVKNKLLEKTLGMCKGEGACVEETEGENAGCLVVKLEDSEEFKDMENPNKVLVRSDGTATYNAKDLAFHFWKFGIMPTNLKFSKFMEQYNGEILYYSADWGEEKIFNEADIVINVIGVEQTYPQKVISKVLKRINRIKQANNLIHVAYEHVSLPEGRFSGREGSWRGFTADELAEEAAERSNLLIKKDYDDRQEIARKIALAAIKYNILRVSPEKKIVFSWNEALNMLGDSGPYLQYSYTRAINIMKKFEEEKGNPVGVFAINEEEERSLAKIISKFPVVLKKCALSFKYIQMTDYANELAVSFNKFYDGVPVLKAEESVKISRLVLVKKFLMVMGNVLYLIGIETMERM